MNKITSRKKSRKYLFQKLFSLAYNFTDKNDFNNSFMTDAYNDNLDEKYLEEMEKIIIENQDKLIYILQLYAPKFPIEKMDITYIVPIFIWASEMLFFSEEIPPKVSINEAIILSKKFGTDTTKKIVNWVLNKVYANYDELKIKIKTIKNIDNFEIFKN